MYLDFFNIQNKPFDLTPNTELFCTLPTHKAALEVLLYSITNEEGFIKITGEVGTGKTLLCRLLLKNLPENFVSVYIPNPNLNSKSLHLQIASELGINQKNVSQQDLVELIFKKLIELKKEDKKAVIIIDEAQTICDNTMEAIRLLTNLETEDEKLLQVVMFGQPELNTKLNAYNMRQLKQRIVFSYHLSMLNKKEVKIYINHRLAKSGYTYGNLFTRSAYNLVFKSTKGVPRLINIICHKAMLAAFSQGRKNITLKDIKRAVKDTESIKYRTISPINLILTTMSIMTIVLMTNFNYLQQIINIRI